MFYHGPMPTDLKWSYDAAAYEEKLRRIAEVNQDARYSAESTINAIKNPGYRLYLAFGLMGEKTEEMKAKEEEELRECYAIINNSRTAEQVELLAQKLKLHHQKAVRLTSKSVSSNRAVEIEELRKDFDTEKYNYSQAYQHVHKELPPEEQLLEFPPIQIIAAALSDRQEEEAVYEDSHEEHADYGMHETTVTPMLAPTIP